MNPYPTAEHGVHGTVTDAYVKEIYDRARLSAEKIDKMIMDIHYTPLHKLPSYTQPMIPRDTNNYDPEKGGKIFWTLIFSVFIIFAITLGKCPI